MRCLLSMCLLAAAALLLGCDDDSTAPDVPPYSLTVNVRDALGQPVTGVRVASMPVVPESFWEPPTGGANRPRTNMYAFSLPAPDTVRLEVRDVAGAMVRLLVAWALPAGLHEIAWDGRGDAGQPLPGGWYCFHFESGDDVDEVPFLLAVCDPEWHALGMVDANGRLEVTERTMVPAFWSPPPVGGIALTPATHLRLELATGAGMDTTFDAIDGPQTFDVTWEDPADFAVHLRIFQADGRTPVPNARIGGMPAIPSWVLMGSYGQRSSVRIPYDLEQESTVRLVIQDVAGEEIRTLVAGTQPAGRHEIMWDGADDDGLGTPSGWYWVRFVASVGGSVVAVDSVGIVQATYEPDDYTLGVTDATGQILLTDRRLVPGFWDLPPVLVTDSDAEIRGTFELTTETLLTVEGAGWVVLDEVLDGWQQLDVEVEDSPWDDEVTAGRRGEPDRPPTALLLPYPNPFN